MALLALYGGQLHAAQIKNSSTKSLRTPNCYLRCVGMLQAQKTSHFRTVLSLLFPSGKQHVSMFMADLSMGIILHPSLLREDIGQMTEILWNSTDLAILIYLQAKKHIAPKYKLLLLVDKCGIPWLRHKTCLMFIFPFWSTMIQDHCVEAVKMTVLPTMSSAYGMVISSWPTQPVTEHLQRWISTGIFRVKHQSHASKSFLAWSILHILTEENFP